MQNFMKTILSAVKTWTKGKIKDSTADWNQSDSNADSYVKNRTHYEEEVPVSVMSEQMVGYYPDTELNNDDGFVFEEGATYIVTCNGTRYELTGRYYSEWDIMFVGNGLYADGVDDNSGVPFAIGGYSDGFMFLTAPFGVYTVSVSTLVDGVETEVIGEQTRYLCWERGLGEIALEIGNAYSVNFYDNTYEFTAVENADASAIIIGDMTQYPFEIWCIDGWLTLYSMTAGIHTISVTNVSNNSQMIDELYVGACGSYDNMDIANLQEGKTYTVVWNGEVYSCVAKKNDGYDDIYIGNPIYAYLDDWDISAKDTGEPFFIATYEPDDWNIIMFDYEKTNTVSVSTTRPVVHKLDPKYLDLPDNLATTDDVQDALDVANEAYQIADNATAMADAAQTTANNAQTTADSKMDKNNPVGTGSFSMNRKAGTTIGAYSYTNGYNNTASGSFSSSTGCETHASRDNEFVCGKFNIISQKYTERITSIADPLLSKTALTVYTTNTKVYFADTYEFDCVTGIFTLTNYAQYSYSQIGTDVANSALEGKYMSKTINGTSLWRYEGHTGQQNTTRLFYYDTIIEAVETPATYANIVGNGTSDTARSNAHTLDWDGNAWYAGDVYVGSTSGTNKDEGSKKLATEEFVTEQLSQLGGGSSVFSLVVTLTDGVASHTSQEIYAHVQGGGTVALLHEGVYYALKNCDSDNASFVGFEDGNGVESIVWKIDDTALAEYFDYRHVIAPTAAQVGQLLSVKAIDENGKPTEWETVTNGGSGGTQSDWNQTDETAVDFIKNKPFGETATTILNCTFTEVPDTEGNLTGEGFYEDTSDATLIIGETYAITFNGATYTCKCLEHEGCPFVGNPAVAGGVYDDTPFVIVRDIDGTLTGKIGWIFVTIVPSYISATYDVTIAHAVTKQIEQKFIPSLSYTPSTTDIRTTKTFANFTLDTQFGLYQANEEDPSYTLKVGELYMVEWDGVKYSCIGQDVSEMFGITNAVAIGNGSAFGMIGGNEPFIILKLNEAWKSYVSLTDTAAGGSHTVRIATFNTNCGHKIKEEYVPEYAKVTLFEEQTLPFSKFLEGTYWSLQNPAPFRFNEGESYIVVFDGVEYITTETAVDSEGNVCIGNLKPITDDDNGMPFMVLTNNWNPNRYVAWLAFNDTTAEHSVAIYKRAKLILTDDHINSLIDSKLGVIENGTY